MTQWLFVCLITTVLNWHWKNNCTYHVLMVSPSQGNTWFPNCFLFTTACTCPLGIAPKVYFVSCLFKVLYFLEHDKCYFLPFKVALGFIWLRTLTLWEHLTWWQWGWVDPCWRVGSELTPRSRRTCVRPEGGTFSQGDSYVLEHLGRDHTRVDWVRKSCASSTYPWRKPHYCHSEGLFLTFLKSENFRDLPGGCG